MAAEVLVKVDGLTKVFEQPWYGTIRALDEVSFEAHAGKVMGILGPNGAGKTTLLRILSAIARPTRGVAQIAGIDVTRHPETVKKHLGFLSYTTGLYDRLTPYEMLRFFGHLYGISRSDLEARIAELVEMLHMAEYLYRRNRFLSTGQRQKVSIARALLHNPDVLLLDEPTLGLDPMGARIIANIVEGLKGSGKCVLVSTHLMEQAERECDEIVLLDHGRVLAWGTVAQIKEDAKAADLDAAFLHLVTRAREAAAAREASA